MKINLQRIFVLLLVILMLFAFNACGDANSIELPPLPTYSDESPAPSPSPKASTKPVQTAKPSPSLSPTVGTEATASPTPVATTTPTPVPSPQPTVESDLPVLTISEMTLPEDMLQLNVASLRGYITTDKGSISSVSAMLVNEAGEAVQSCYYQPMAPNFSLGGTVNAELQFGLLSPGTYFYVLRAEAENVGKTVQKEFAYHSFTVYASQAEMDKDLPEEEKANNKISLEDSNAATIWNFLVVYLDNPYGAAGVLANIEFESGCEPTRVQGDFSQGYTYSKQYTQLVDEGNINRDSFIWSLPGQSYGSGYGLCQWTLDRKEGLYDLAKKDGTSVGDLNTQCTYLVMELELNYPELSKFLKTTTDARAAAREFFYVFEQGSAMGDRPDIAEDYIEAFAK